MRYRLRFLLQEIDVTGPEIVIGRSPDCQLTIEDPLISRQHAKIALTPTGVLFSDLGSRNGSRVNGRVVKEPVRLRDGDRIRVGTQEIVFNELRDRAARAPRETGALRQCGSCRVAFPEGSPVCPHCGIAVKLDDDTMTGLFVEPRRSFTFALLGDVIDRALSSNRVPEAQRVLKRAKDEIDESVRAGDALEPTQLAMVASYVVRIAILARDVGWLIWLADVYRRVSQAPPESVVVELEKLGTNTLESSGGVVRSLAQHAAALPQERVGRDTVARLSELASRLGA